MSVGGISTVPCPKPSSIGAPCLIGRDNLLTVWATRLPQEAQIRGSEINSCELRPELQAGERDGNLDYVFLDMTPSFSVQNRLSFGARQEADHYGHVLSCPPKISF